MPSCRLDRIVSIIVYWGYIGIMEKKVEATTLYWGYLWIDVALCRVVRGHQGFADDAEAFQGEGRFK